MAPKDTFDDKSYVMAQLHQAMERGVLNEALSLIAEGENNEAATNWQRIRQRMDQLLEATIADTIKPAYEVRFEES